MISALLDKTARIERPVYERTPTGETVRSWALIAEGVPLYAQLLSDESIEVDAGEVQRDRWRGFFLPTVDLRQFDRVTLGDVAFEAATINLIRGHHVEVTLYRMPVGGA